MFIITSSWTSNGPGLYTLCSALISQYHLAVSRQLYLIAQDFDRFLKSFKSNKPKAIQVITSLSIFNLSRIYWQSYYTRMKASLILFLTSVTMIIALPVQDTSVATNNRLDLGDGLEDIVHDLGNLVDDTLQNIDKALHNIGGDVNEILRG